MYEYFYVWIVCMTDLFVLCHPPAETEFEEGVVTPYSNPPELPDVMKAPESSAAATD